MCQQCHTVPCVMDEAENTKESEKTEEPVGTWNWYMSIFNPDNKSRPMLPMPQQGHGG